IGAGREVEYADVIVAGRDRLPEGQQRLVCAYGASIEPQRGARRIVGGQLARRKRPLLAIGQFDRWWGVRKRMPTPALDVGARRPTWSQQRRLTDAGDDRGFEADKRGAAVQHQVDTTPQVREHVL